MQRERDIANSLVKYNKQDHPVGEKLPEAIQVYRIKTVMAFMKAGVPLSKIDCFREILEENAFSLSGSQHLQEIVPFILKEERSKVKKRLTESRVSHFRWNYSRL